jgi:hypothetical protein
LPRECLPKSCNLDRHREDGGQQSYEQQKPILFELGQCGKRNQQERHYLAERMNTKPVLRIARMMPTRRFVGGAARLAGVDDVANTWNICSATKRSAPPERFSLSTPA